jgi:hypothetical protein
VRWLSIVLSTLMVAVVLVLSGLSSPEPAFAVPAVNQCNGIDNVGGQALACDVTVVNNLDLATGVTSSTLTTRVCQGAAGVTDLLCTTTPGTFTDLTSSIVQCDGSGNGGGSTVTCTVSVTNNITGDATASPATVNQCVGSATGGGGGGLVCSPLSSTSGATITQCNGSGNGGGATVTCTVGPSTASSALPVTISQCNGSGSGGGSLVTCSSSITNNILAAAPVDTTAPGSGTTLAPGATTPGNTTPRATVPREIPKVGTDTTIGVAAGALALLAGVAFVLVTRRGRTTRPT